MKHKSPQDCKIDRLKMENLFISRLNTLTPNGENIKLNIIKEPFYMVMPYSKVTSSLAWDIKSMITQDTQVTTSIAYTKYRNIKEILCPSIIKA